MKKISLIITSLVFCIAAVFVFPAKEAQANPLAVGGALYLGGAGIYVVGTLGVAAVAGLVELDSCPSCQEDMEAHAGRVWNTATTNAKNGLQLMVDASVGVASALTATDATFNTWMDTQIDGLGKKSATLHYNNGEDFPDGSLLKVTPDQIGTQTPGIYLGSAVAGTGKQIIYINSLGITSQLNTFALYISGGNRLYFNTGEFKVLTDAQYASAISLINGSPTYGTFKSLMATYFGSTSMSYAVGTEFANVASRGVSATREAWQDMKDAGLVLPTDTARPLAGNIPLTYDPVTDAYSGIDGVNVPREDITGYDYGKPHWKTLEDLAMLGLSGLGAGLYIDGWASSDSITSTYDPTADLTTTVTTGTTTGVTTGVTSTVTTTTTTTGDTTGNPPVNPPPTTAPKTGEPLNPFKAKPMPIAALTGLFQLLAALIFYLIRMFTFIATIALIAPTPIDNPYFLWFVDATFYGIKPFRLVQNLALFFLGFSVYKSVRRVFG